MISHPSSFHSQEGVEEFCIPTWRGERRVGRGGWLGVGEGGWRGEAEWWEGRGGEGRGGEDEEGRRW